MAGRGYVRCDVCAIARAVQTGAGPLLRSKSQRVVTLRFPPSPPPARQDNNNRNSRRILPGVVIHHQSYRDITPPAVALPVWLGLVGSYRCKVGFPQAFPALLRRCQGTFIIFF